MKEKTQNGFIDLYGVAEWERLCNAYVTYPKDANGVVLCIKCDGARYISDLRKENPQLFPGEDVEMHLECVQHFQEKVQEMADWAGMRCEVSTFN